MRLSVSLCFVVLDYQGGGILFEALEQTQPQQLTSALSKDAAVAIDVCGPLNGCVFLRDGLLCFWRHTLEYTFAIIKPSLAQFYVPYCCLEQAGPCRSDSSDHPVN
jgi:hypothetical protein